MGTVISEDNNAAKYSSKKITTHPYYLAASLENDIGIIQLSKTVQLTAYIQTITLDFDILKENTQVTISGYGRTSDSSDTISDFLRYARLTTITNTECDQTFGEVSDEVVCAKGAKFESVCNVSTKVLTLHSVLMY